STSSPPRACGPRRSPTRATASPPRSPCPAAPSSGCTSHATTARSAVSVRRDSTGGELLQGVAAEPVADPLVAGDGADGLVELDRRLVPVEDRPFEAVVPAFHADAGQLRQERLAVPAAPVLRPDVDVLQVDAVGARPGGETEETEGEADHLAVVVLGHVGEHLGLGAEQSGVQLLLGGLGLVERLLVLDEFADHPVDGGDVVRGGG